MKVSVMPVVVAFLLCVFSLGGCSLTSQQSPILLSSVRPPLPGTKTSELTLSRKKISEALGRNDENSQVRIVEIFRRAEDSNTSLPEYRLFGITTESIYWSLGLRNADVLVAAHDYVIKSPNAFRQYVALVPNELESKVEIRRNGAPMLLHYRFVD